MRGFFLPGKFVVKLLTLSGASPLLKCIPLWEGAAPDSDGRADKRLIVRLKHETFVIKLMSLRPNVTVYAACGIVAFPAKNCCAQKSFT
ncbi:hypothetical protein TU77_11950 [Pseudomonas synxantha]|nr:hypothetical protein TU77_11950 [Pseudomonas synxantha]